HCHSHYDGRSSKGNSKMQADQGLAASTLAGANAAAVNHRLAEGKVLERPSSERDAIDCVMKEIAAHGLMEIGFLDSGRNSGGDSARLRRIPGPLASNPGPVAPTFVVNPVLAGPALALLGIRARR